MEQQVNFHEWCRNISLLYCCSLDKSDIMLNFSKKFHFCFDIFHFTKYSCSSFSKLLLHLKYNCANYYPNTENIIWLSCKVNWLESIFYSLWLLYLKLFALFVKTGKLKKYYRNIYVCYIKYWPYWSSCRDLKNVQSLHPVQVGVKKWYRLSSGFRVKIFWAVSKTQQLFFSSPIL